MSDPMDADEAGEVQEFQAKEQAEYDAKPCCGKCGHHPSDSLHQCKRREEPVRLVEIKAEGEVDHLPIPSLEDLVVKAAEWFPGADAPKLVEESRRLMVRWMEMDQAYRAGLAQGRDIRERIHRRLGWGWPELDPLTPRERTYVMEQVRRKVTA